MSKQADDIYDLLIKTFPHLTIIKEHYVRYKGQQLFFDFFIKNYNILIEVQGRQHSEYVEHFHGDRLGFIASKKRDNLKIAYCEDNNLTFIVINYNEKIETGAELLRKINEVMSK